MVSQEEMKAQLKELMQLPENQVCVDCDDKRPTWASLLVPPPGSSFKDPIGCFCCYQCSGAHRSLGTHICFVRSTNLDEWKEKELVAMKDGGNKLINGLFEINLSDKERSALRPHNRTCLDERSEFIYNKYQHRKWYNEDAYKKSKLREKADAAIKIHKTKVAGSGMEDDFFAARTAKTASSDGDRFAAKKNDENEWWKNHSTNVQNPNVSMSKTSKGKDSRKPTDFLGDRRQLLSTLQMESKSRLMSDLSGLGIDIVKGATPSQIKSKAFRISRREKRTGLSPSPMQDRVKLSISATKEVATKKSLDQSRRALSSSSGDEDSRAGNSKPSSNRSIRRKAPGRSASGPVPSTTIAAADADDAITIESKSRSNRKQKVGRDNNGSNRLGRMKSFDDSNDRKNNRQRSRSSSARRSRGAARNNRALVASLLYDESQKDNIAAGLATVDGFDDVSSKRITRRGNERLIGSLQSSSSIALDESSSLTREIATASISRSPSPLDQDSRRRALRVETPPRSPTKGAPIKVKRVHQVL